MHICSLGISVYNTWVAECVAQSLLRCGRGGRVALSLQKLNFQESSHLQNKVAVDIHISYFNLFCSFNSRCWVSLVCNLDGPRPMSKIECEIPNSRFRGAIMYKKTARQSFPHFLSLPLLHDDNAAREAAGFSSRTSSFRSFPLVQWCVRARDGYPAWEARTGGAVLLSLRILDRIDAFLEKFERGEEDGVHNARTAHGYAQATVHVASEELDFDRRYLLASRIHQTVALIYALCGIDRV